MGDRPSISGNVQIDRKKVGKVALWSQEVDEGSKRPVMRGNIEIDGKKLKVGLWEQNLLIGTVQDDSLKKIGRLILVPKFGEGGSGKAPDVRGYLLMFDDRGIKEVALWQNGGK